MHVWQISSVAGLWTAISEIKTQELIIKYKILALA